MSSATVLMERIDSEFAAAENRVNQLKSQQSEIFHGRQERLEVFEQNLEQLREIWEPRLSALAKKFGERVDVKPQIEPGRRSAKFAFHSDLASIDLQFGVSPDADVRKLIFSYDLSILPILMKFDSHDEIEFPLNEVDEASLGQWMDDRIIDFVKIYLSLHENKYYLKGHMVEDPIVHVQFPKYAAGATLKEKGKTIYFVSDASLQEYQKRQAKPK
jgi:YHS domain-containing protein